MTFDHATQMFVISTHLKRGDDLLTRLRDVDGFTHSPDGQGGIHLTVFIRCEGDATLYFLRYG